MSDVEDEPAPEEPVMSEEDVEEDFEPTASAAQGSKRDSRKSLHLSLPPPPNLSLSQSREARSHPSHPPRSGSMATVKLKRRTKLAEKLKEIFELEDIQEVVAGTSNLIHIRSTCLWNLSQKCRVGYCDQFVSLKYLDPSYAATHVHLQCYKAICT